MVCALALKMRPSVENTRFKGVMMVVRACVRACVCVLVICECRHSM